jgi:uncharacterized protein (DUF2147 family)
MKFGRQLALGTFAFSSLALAATGASAADISGTYVRPSTGTQVEFYDCAGKVCGKIVAVKDKSKEKTVGTIILKGATRSDDKTFKGELLNTEDGKTYNGVLTVVSAKEIRLEGCVLGGIVCKGENWTKVK